MEYRGRIEVPTAEVPRSETTEQVGDRLDEDVQIKRRKRRQSRHRWSRRKLRKTGYSQVFEHLTDRGVQDRTQRTRLQEVIDGGVDRRR
ncbi:hypothetical protein CSW57_18095 [Williamsia muralis]|uniref:Uncharacterized protein n=1 Tax=Williamsia marianensis TaxID=85044 RepID=A0A2G3PIN2_WILMA|nr:hypothetical protein CSW57_18095 [Williamsia marianensis]